MPTEDTIIVGAGPIGLACAISALRRNIDPLVIDTGGIVHSIYRYPVGMGFFTTPELLEIGGHPFACAGEKPTREEALKYYRGVVRSENIRTALYTKLINATPTSGGIVAELEGPDGKYSVQCQRLVLATGYYDNHNRLDIPGIDLPHVSYYFDEAHASYDRDVVVIGGRNSAVEASLLLYRAGARTTLVYRGATFPTSVKYWIKPDIENRITAGEINAFMESHVTEIHPRHVIVMTKDGSAHRVPADRVYALVGFHPDFELFTRIGIELDDTTGCPAGLDPKTQETNVPGVYMAGSITAGWETKNIFIENGRFDGEKIFG